MGNPKTTTRQICRPKVVLWPAGKAGGRIDISNQVTSFSYTKALNQPVGSWTVSLLPTQGGRSPSHMGRSADLERVVRPHGVISVGFDEPGGICIGLIDQVERSRTLAGPIEQATAQAELMDVPFDGKICCDGIIRYTSGCILGQLLDLRHPPLHHLNGVLPVSDIAVGVLKIAVAGAIAVRPRH